MMEFTGNVARKKGPPAILAVEIARARLASQLAEATGIFYVPKVVDFNEAAGVADFERLDYLLSLADMAMGMQHGLEAALRRAAQALVVIHAHLVLPESLKAPLPPEWMRVPGPQAFLHGDFTPSNVCLHEPTGRLVILDWSSAPFLRTPATFGPPYFDLLWFALSLFALVPANRILPLRGDDMADTFIGAYLTAAKTRLDRPCFDLCRELGWRLFREGRRRRRVFRPWYKTPLDAARERVIHRRLMAYHPLSPRS